MTAKWLVRLIGFVGMILAALPGAAVEHPGILHKDDICSSCHANKMSGKSVHSAMKLACTVCHLAQTEGDMTTLNLLMPKEQICFACHERGAEAKQHPSGAKGLCVDCHDSHNSDRRMLLREPNEAPRSQMLPPRAEKE